MKIVNEKIKQLYGTKANFCQKEGHTYKDFASKIRTVQAKLDWLNVFLKPLGLWVVIVEDVEGGTARGIDTSGFEVGDILGSDPTKPGHLMKVDPINTPFAGELLVKMRNNTGAPLSGVVALDDDGELVKVEPQTCPDCGSSNVFDLDTRYECDDCGAGWSQG